MLLYVLVWLNLSIFPPDKGILIGRYAIGNDRDDVSSQKAKMSATLMEELSASNIGEYLK
jgi:hypothetical protein